MSVVLALLMGNWRMIAIGLAVVVVMGSGLAWVHSKNAAVHRAQVQRNAAVRAYVLGEVDLISARINEVTLGDAISRQNVAIAQQGEDSARRLQDAATGLARAQAVHRSDEARLAVLRRPLVAATPCQRSDEAAQRAREALR